MFSRRSAALLAKLYRERFSRAAYERRAQRQVRVWKIDKRRLYDFLYVHEEEAWLCNAASGYEYPDHAEDFIKKLHTGESQYAATKDWSAEARRRLGQKNLTSLAEYVLTDYPPSTDESFALHDELKRNLELDGYVLMSGRLVPSEADVLDVAEAVGALQSLYRELKLGKPCANAPRATKSHVGSSQST